jgi:hypothetical protein
MNSFKKIVERVYETVNTVNYHSSQLQDLRKRVFLLEEPYRFDLLKEVEVSCNGNNPVPGVIVNRQVIINEGFGNKYKEYEVRTKDGLFAIEEEFILPPADKKETTAQFDHKATHCKLHHSLDDLLADFIKHTGGGTTSTIRELIEWSYQQTQKPTE